MKRILPEFEFSAEQLNTVNELSAECGLTADTVKILYGRGVCTKEEIERFIHPSREHFISPFDMGGMKEAVALITRARDEGWSVVVYGDYDADGVCASTIMGGALRDFGIEAQLVIPERRNGYGLSKELIDGFFEEYFPQLVITVDCGISCAEEVEYIKEQGAEVIVTDHHELPEKLPDCICINPKFNDGYIYDNLCGAGVAFKTACALNGKSAYKYLDLAAIATVADSVPLTGENRDIVAEGLKIINSRPRSCYCQFFKGDGAVTAQSLAFSVAPKINAAGRMGDANAALQLFNSTDEGEIFSLASKLTSYNLERQKYCDELYLSAKEILVKEDIGKIIVLAGEEWNAGFVGIVAARLAEEFGRPAILFVRHGDMLRGSARSVEGVNVFEALKACSQYIEEFGGHSQAAGVSVKESNFAPFKQALEEYISQNYTAEDFEPTVYVSGTLTGAFSPVLARELEMLEPYGVGNKRPVFLTEEEAMPSKLVKAQSPHLAVRGKGIELVYFGGARFAKLLECSAPKKIIFEYNVSTFKGREYIKGFVRDVIYTAEAGAHAGEEIAVNGVISLAERETECEAVPISVGEILRECEACPDFGTLFVAYDYAALERFPELKKLNCDLFVPSQRNGSSGVLISPQPDADLSVYKKVIFLEKCGVHISSLAGKRVYVNSEGLPPSFVKQLSTDRTDLLKSFSALGANVKNVLGGSAEEAATRNSFPYPAPQTAFALTVFSELGLISFEKGFLTVFRGIKTELTASPTYVLISNLQKGV